MKMLTFLLISLFLSTTVMADGYSHNNHRKNYRDGYRAGYRDGYQHGVRNHHNKPAKLPQHTSNKKQISSRSSPLMTYMNNSTAKKP